MPGTVEDFMRRFGSSGSIDDTQAEQYYDRFASTHPEDREFDNETMYRGTTEYLGQLPDDQFEQAAHTAFTQAPRPQQPDSWTQIFIYGDWALGRIMLYMVVRSPRC